LFYRIFIENPFSLAPDLVYKNLTSLFLTAFAPHLPTQGNMKKHSAAEEYKEAVCVRSRSEILVYRTQIPIIIIIIIIIIFSGTAAQRGLWSPRPRDFVNTHTD
jgi:hypothetical protein